MTYISLQMLVIQLQLVVWLHAELPVVGESLVLSREQLLRPV